MAGVTTAMTTSFKGELFNGGHCFGGTVTPTGTAGSGAFTVTSVSAMTGVAVGMGVSGTNVAASSVVASTDSATQLTLSKVTTGVISGGTLTITGDVFKIALIKTTPTGTYDATFTNVGTPGSGSPTTSNLGTDEASGTGYSSGGNTLTQTSATTSGTTAFTTFADTSWSGATFSFTGAIIYNSSQRLAGVAGRAVSTHNIGDTSVSAGTVTLVFPTANASLAILRLQ